MRWSSAACTSASRGLEDRVAARLLVAARDQRVQRERVGVGNGVLLFDEDAEDSGLEQRQRGERGRRSCGSRVRNPHVTFGGGDPGAAEGCRGAGARRREGDSGVEREDVVAGLGAGDREEDVGGVLDAVPGRDDRVGRQFGDVDAAFDAGACGCVSGSLRSFALRDSSWGSGPPRPGGRFGGLTEVNIVVMVQRSKRFVLALCIRKAYP